MYCPRPVRPFPRPSKPGCTDIDGQELVLEDLTREQVLDWRPRAAHDQQVVHDQRVVHDHIARHGEHSAQRLFTRELVKQVTRLFRLQHLSVGCLPWGQS
ncbi:hypothetical protein [Streptomyces sp. YIM S03343]